MMADEKTTEPEPTIEETMTVLLRQAREDEKAEPAPVDEAKADGADEKATESAGEKTPERARGPDGKFIAKEPATEKPVPEAKTETKDQSAETKATPALPASEPPASWSSAAKAEFAKLPPIVQEQVLKREADIAKGLEQRAAKLKTLEPLETVLEPVRQRLAFNGVDPARYVGQLIAADEMLRTKPAEAIKWIANAYGIDLGKAATEPVADELPADPQIAALSRTVGSLSSQLQQIQAATQQQQQAALHAQIEAFKSDPKHAHFEEVRQDMAALIQSAEAQGRPMTLQDAYDRAIWANAQTRASLLAAERKAEEDRRREAVEARTDRARKIAATNLHTTGASSGATPKYDSMEEEMMAELRRLRGAA